MEGIRTYPVGHLRPFLRNGSQVRIKGLPNIRSKDNEKTDFIAKFVKIPIGPNRNTWA